jgi:hypothetical protein
MERLNPELQYYLNQYYWKKSIRVDQYSLIECVNYYEIWHTHISIYHMKVFTQIYRKIKHHMKVFTQIYRKTKLKKINVIGKNQKLLINTHLSNTFIIIKFHVIKLHQVLLQIKKKPEVHGP